MKNASRNRIFFLTLITFLPLAEIANAHIVAFETITGYRSSPPFGWNYSYDIGYYNDSIQVEVDVSLTGLPPTSTLLSTWEDGFESAWSVDISRFGVPIVFNLDWVTSDPHLTIDVKQSGRGNLSSWPIEHRNPGMLAAHELGHQLGLFDEYSGGAVDPDHPERLNSGGLMWNYPNNGAGVTLDYYYDDFLGWYQLNVVPEPSSSFLFAVGGLALIFRRSNPKR